MTSSSDFEIIDHEDALEKAIQHARALGSAEAWARIATELRVTGQEAHVDNRDGSVTLAPLSGIR